VCIFVGAAMGAAYLALGATLSASVPLWQALRGFPMAMLYSLLIAGPVGLVAGISGALVASALAEGSLRGATKQRWLLGGAAAGSVVGLLLALYYLMTNGPLSFGVMTVVACACSGALVGWLAWREFGEGVTPG
jgi:hypothetical protein